MKLYIGNATRQDAVFSVQTSRMRRRVYDIEAGGSVDLAGDVSAADLAEIVAHHSRYGLVSIEAAESARDFYGLCYSADQPLDADRLQRAMTRQNAAVAEG